MASKRQLYKPASKDVSLKTKRKPLVQGRLVEKTPYDAVVDPTLSPRRCVPKLTEMSSPQAEPPSHILDLSDAELETNLNSGSGSPPVMVLDASHMEKSPLTSEVDFVIAFEDSPARVVCHSPRNSNSSKASKNHHSSLVKNETTVTAISHNNNNVPHWSIPVNTVPRVGGSASKSKPPIKKLFPGSDFNESNNLNNSQKSSNSNLNINLQEDQPHISSHSRGIIQEILAQELGSNNVTGISLCSQGSPQNSGIQNTYLSAFGKSPRAPITSSPASSSQRVQENNGHQESNSQIDRQTKLSLKFDDDSDTSVDRIPVRETKKVPISHAESDNSESDACSLHEYVTPKKSSGVFMKPKAGEKIKRNQSQSNLIQKKKVPARYMQNTLSSSSSKNSVPPSNRNVKKIVKQDKCGLKRSGSIRGKFLAQNKEEHSKSTLNNMQGMTKKYQDNFTDYNSSHTLLQDSVLSTQSSQKASTPTYGQETSLSQSIDASAIHSESTLSANISTLQPKEGVKSSDKDHYPDIDILWSRYVQGQFIRCELEKSFKEQEAKAMKQLYDLWSLVEEKREETGQLEREVARLRALNLVDQMLSVEEELLPLINAIPQMEKDFNSMAATLETSRHQLPTQDVYFPPGEASAKDVEYQLQQDLAESEQLLKDISILTNKQAPEIGQYRQSLETTERTMGAMAEGLAQCNCQLDTVAEMTTRLVSLELQSKWGHGHF